jgi:hypothetical protein
MFGFLAPVLSAAGTFFGTKAGVAVATAAASSAVNAIAQADADKKRNAAAEAAYQRQLAQQQKERDRQAAIDAANKAEQLAIDEKNRATAKADAANKYVDMNAAAQKAGLNPLTVLRATGGTGFGAYGGYGAVMRQGLVQPTISAPILSSSSVSTQIGLGAVKGFIDYKSNQKANEHYDRLNELDLEQRQLDIKLSKKHLNTIDNPKQPYRYNDDGTPQLNAYGQHMYVDENAAAVFPTLQGYITPNGQTLSLPHEQLLDMSVTSLPTATTAIAGGIAAAKSKNAPTVFRYPTLSMSGTRFSYGTLSGGAIPHTLQ